MNYASQNKNSNLTQVTLDMLDAEIESARRKFNDSIEHNVAHGNLDRPIVVITEELGESAEAAMDLENFDQANAAELNKLDEKLWTERHQLIWRLRAELIQVAACALRMVESL